MVGGGIDEQAVFNVGVRLLRRALVLLGGSGIVGVHGLVAYRNPRPLIQPPAVPSNQITLRADRSRHAHTILDHCGAVALGWHRGHVREADRPKAKIVGTLERSYQATTSTTLNL